MTLERIAECRLVSDAFRSCVEGRRQLLQGLFPQVRNEAPAHRHKLVSATVTRPHDLDSVGQSDVVVGLKIASGARVVVQVVDLAPRVALGEASAYGDQPIMRGLYPVVCSLTLQACALPRLPRGDFGDHHAPRLN
jgi:hypothetical protein